MGGIDESSGDTLYICRAKIGAKKTPGKLHKNTCYVPLGGKEYEFTDAQYEVLASHKNSEPSKSSESSEESDYGALFQ